MSTYQSRSISKGIDWVTVWLYAFILAVGIMCIFMVEYNSDQPALSSFLTGKTNYSKQILFTGICVVVATFILLSDSKLYTAFANLLYVFGILLMLATFVIGKDINGSKSWIPLGGGFNLQPAELCKIFAALALAKYMARQDIDFSKVSAQIVAGAIAMLPAVLSVAQNETGLALVYAAFFIVMYREGLPGWILVVGFSFGALVVATLILPPLILFIVLTIFAGVVVYFNIKKIRRSFSFLFVIIFIWL